MSHTKHSEVQLTHDLLKDYGSSRENWAKQAVEDNEFRNGKQWTEEQSKALRARAQEPIVVNVIHSAVEQAKAMLTANKPRFQSTSRETSDTEVGRIFSDLMSYIWDHSNGNVELKQSIDDYYVKGMGVMMAYTDPDKDFGRGEVCLKSLDPLEVYFDPNSKDPFARDAGHIIVGKILTQNQLVDYYPEYEELIKEATETSYINTTTESRYGRESQDVTLKSRLSGETMSGDRELELFERYTKIRIPYMKIYDPFSNEEKNTKRAGI